MKFQSALLVVSAGLLAGWPGRAAVFNSELELFTAAYNAGAVLTIDDTGNQASIRWPEHLIDWSLERSTNLETWISVATAPVRVGGFFRVNVPKQAQEFFRLRHAPPP